MSGFSLGTPSSEVEGPIQRKQAWSKLYHLEVHKSGGAAWQAVPVETKKIGKEFGTVAISELVSLSCFQIL